MLYNSTPSLVFGGLGSELGRLSGPRCVDVHHLTGMIHVADYGNARVCEFNSSGHVISCMSGYRTADGITVPFNTPFGVSVMTDERMIICDYHRVMLMYTNTTIIHVWGSLTSGQGLGQFNYPHAVASQGHLIYVADYYNKRIQVLNVTSVDDVEEIKVTADDLSVSCFTRSVDVDPESGDIFVIGLKSDGSGINIFFIYNMTGHYVRNVTASDLGVDVASLFHIALYRDQIYVTDDQNDCIHIMSYNGSYIQRIGYSGIFPGGFRFPFGVAVHSASGHLVVTDVYNNNVQIFMPL